MVQGPAKLFGAPPFFPQKALQNEPRNIIVIYITSKIKPSFYYPCVADEKVLAVADF